MNDPHISDDRLIDICVTSPQSPGEQGHLSACTRCEARRVEIVGILSELDDAATQEAGTVFPQTRLERQHAQILHRVEYDGRPAQIVAFPAAADTPRRRFVSSRPRVRWAAAAAAAAFLAGVLTGRVTHNFTFAQQPAPVHVFVGETAQLPLRPVPTTFSEDQFLDEIESAAQRNGPAALRPLDAMTPRAWEVR